MGEIVAGFPRVKGKLQHLHTRQLGVRQELVDLRREKTEVLRNNLQIGEPARQRPHQLHAGALPPAAPFGCFGSVGNRPVALQPPEMVDTDDVKKTPRALNPPDPPAKAVLLHAGIVVQRVPPQLAVGAEVVRRYAGDLRGGMPLP